MAFDKLDSFSKKVSDLSDKPSLTPTALKAQFDAAPEELRGKFNDLIDALKKTTSGDSGAKNIGATTVTGITGTDVQTILQGLKTYTDGFLNTGNTNMRMEIVSAVFFTNGTSNDSDAVVAFSKSFASVPAVFPGSMSNEQSYADVIRYPFIHNVTKDGFSVKITTGDSSKLGSATPANIFMSFLVIGK